MKRLLSGLLLALGLLAVAPAEAQQSLTVNKVTTSSITVSGSPGACLSANTNKRNAQTGTSYAIVNGDQCRVVTFSNSSPVAVTIAQAGAGGLFVNGWMTWLQNVGTGTVTITPSTSTVNGSATLTLTQGQGAGLFSDGTNYVAVKGGGASGATVFTGLTDAPASYSGNAGKLVAVNGGETGLEFLAAGTGAVTAITAGSGLSGGTITTTGTIALSATLTPQGRLTLVSGTPVMGDDSSSHSTIYYDSFVGNVVPVWDGSKMVPLTIGSNEISVVLDSTNHLATHVYDVFAYSNSGTLALCVGPTWHRSATVTMTIAVPGVVTWTAHGLFEGSFVEFTTTGSLPINVSPSTTYYVGRSPTTDTFKIATSIANAAAGTFITTSTSQSGTHTGHSYQTGRGTGAGTSELELKNGVWTNKNDLSTCYNNSVNAGTITANKATYLGSFYALSNGNTVQHINLAAASGGAGPVLGLYNAYNRVPVSTLTQDTTSSWSYGTNTNRPYNNSVLNRAWFLDGLRQSVPVANQMSLFAGALQPTSGVLLDASDQQPRVMATTSSASFVPGQTTEAWSPVLGLHYVQQVERSIAGACTYYGSPWSGLLLRLMM